MVIVDVLSFSTAVDIAVARGASVLPYFWKDDSSTRFALEKGAMLAAADRTKGGYSLAPASLLSIPKGTLLVLPSPNGSSLSLRAQGVPVYTACLRNAPAVAKTAASHGSRITVIPAGEQWQDSSLRPCLEDLMGAGSVLQALTGSASPEAEMAMAAFERFRERLDQTLLLCGSGKELVERGFMLDVELAAQYAVSDVAPMLARDRFINGAASFR